MRSAVCPGQPRSAWKRVSALDRNALVRAAKSATRTRAEITEQPRFSGPLGRHARSGRAREFDSHISTQGDPTGRRAGGHSRLSSPVRAATTAVVSTQPARIDADTHQRATSSWIQRAGRPRAAARPAHRPPAGTMVLGRLAWPRACAPGMPAGTPSVPTVRNSSNQPAAYQGSIAVADQRAQQQAPQPAGPGQLTAALALLGDRDPAGVLLPAA